MNSGGATNQCTSSQNDDRGKYTECSVYQAANSVALVCKRVKDATLPGQQHVNDRYRRGNGAKRETRSETRRRRQRSRFGLKRNAGRLPDTVTGSTDEEIWRYRLLRAGVHQEDLNI